MGSIFAQMDCLKKNPTVLNRTYFNFTHSIKSLCRSKCSFARLCLVLVIILALPLNVYPKLLYSELHFEILTCLFYFILKTWTWFIASIPSQNNFPYYLPMITQIFKEFQSLHMRFRYGFCTLKYERICYID